MGMRCSKQRSYSLEEEDEHLILLGTTSGDSAITDEEEMNIISAHMVEKYVWERRIQLLNSLCKKG